MSHKLPAVKAKEVIKVAKKIGFIFDRQKGSHAVYYRSSDKLRVVIPIHSGVDMKPKTLCSIIEDMGLTVEEFIKYL